MPGIGLRERIAARNKIKFPPLQDFGSSVRIPQTQLSLLNVNIELNYINGQIFLISARYCKNCISKKFKKKNISTFLGLYSLF